jgi:sigma-B regulation protein RsbU (phosphoserine phosphatase)
MPEAEKIFKAKILLVDDDSSLSRLFQYSLKKEGYDCHTACNGNEGYQKAKQLLPDLIISDIMMPNMNGFEFRKIVLEDPEIQKIPFIFLTAKSGEDDILEGYDLGISDYVVKTSGPKVLAAKVSALLANIEKERVKAVSEITKAADNISMKVVPDIPPLINGFAISHWHLPFGGVPGGDFIDYFTVNQDVSVAILGDVMGKKWGAWYFAVAYAGYIRSAVRVILQNARDLSSKSILTEVNAAIFQDSRIADVFATLSVIVTDNKTGIINYSGAGDLPMIYYNSNSRSANFVVSDGLLLGFSQNGDYDERIIEMKPGDSVYLYTDGIIEARDPMGNQLGKENLLKMIEIIPGHIDPIHSIKIRMNEFTDMKFDDDVSIIAIKRNLG